MHGVFFLFKETVFISFIPYSVISLTITFTIQEQYGVTIEAKSFHICTLTSPSEVILQDTFVPFSFLGHKA